MKRTPWTPEEVEQFIKDHEKILAERGYPPEIVEECREVRRKWLAKVPVEKAHEKVND